MISPSISLLFNPYLDLDSYLFQWYLYESEYNENWNLNLTLLFNILCCYPLNHPTIIAEEGYFVLDGDIIVCMNFLQIRDNMVHYLRQRGNKMHLVTTVSCSLKEFLPFFFILFYTISPSGLYYREIPWQT